MATFDVITRGTPTPDGLTTEVPEGWGQGRSTFGGVLAAVGYEACAARAEAPPRMLTARLVEAVTLGTLEARVAPTRVGRSVQLWSAELRQSQQRVGIVDVVFGVSRESSVTLEAERAPAGGPEDGMPVPYVPGITPELLQNFELRWLEGSVPFSGGDDPRVGGLCRHKTAASGVGALLGLIDAWPSPVLGLANRPVPASTVQWSVHLTGAALPDDGWARFRSEMVVSAGGYATMHQSLWAPNGPLLAWSEQLVAVYG